MGEISEMIQEGILCSECGGYVDDNESGHPRKCNLCQPKKKKKKKKKKSKGASQ